jgi:hypothetical protein
VWLGSCSWWAPHAALANFPGDSEQNQSTVTQVRFGTPVEVELLQDLYENGTIQDVRLRVRKSVWVGDFIVIEEGAEAAGTASIKTPEIGTDGAVTLLAKSAVSVTGAQIPLVGSYTVTGSLDCPFYWDCLRYLWTRGGFARMPKGSHFQADVGQSVELSNDALQAFMNVKFAATTQAITRCDHIATLRVYFLPEDTLNVPDTFQREARHQLKPAKHAQEIFLDGKEVGQVPPSSVLTLVPSTGTHVISTKSSFLTLDVRQCTPYYARILRVSSGRKTSLAVKLIGPEHGEVETRDLQEVVNHE